MKTEKFQNSIALSGLMLKDGNLKTLGEFDFIVILPASKTIIQIEAKRGNNPKNRTRAEKQLNRGRAFFEENFPFPSSENWNYVKMMCFGELVDNDVCQNCKPFILGSNFLLDKTTQSISDKIGKQFLSFINTIFDGKDTRKANIVEINFPKN
jgi:hypothetical protein